MPQKSNRDRRRRNAGPPVNNSSAAPANGQYAKYLPVWMKDGSTPPPRPRVRRAPRNRPVGGYTPGKFAAGNDPLSG